MTEILSAIGARYERSIVDNDLTEFRKPPFDATGIVTASYAIDLVTPVSFAENYIDHPVCRTCPLYTLDEHILTTPVRGIECLGPDEASERKTAEDTYELEASILIEEYASGKKYGNCGIIVDTDLLVEERVSIRK